MPYGADHYLDECGFTPEGRPLECLNGPSDECKGPIEYRILPGPADARSFPRCEFHFAQRLESAERDLELLSPCIPSWFDPANAGEHWDEDY